jgi:hypothetical protein
MRSVLPLALIVSLCGCHTSNKTLAEMEAAIALYPKAKCSRIEKVIENQELLEVGLTLAVSERYRKSESEDFWSQQLFVLRKQPGGYRVQECCTMGGKIYPPEIFLKIRKAVLRSAKVDFKWVMYFRQATTYDKHNLGEIDTKIPGILYVAQTGSADAGLMSGTGEEVVVRISPEGEAEVVSVRPVRY